MRGGFSELCGFRGEMEGGEITSAAKKSVDTIDSPKIMWRLALGIGRAGIEATLGPQAMLTETVSPAPPPGTGLPVA
jgi:hypothetical protein